MGQDNRNETPLPGDEVEDPLTELLRRGARDLIKQAVEAELATFLAHYRDIQLPDGRQAVVRNGYQPERTVQTGIGDVPVQSPKVRDRTGSGIRFHSGLLPPYLRRTRSMEELVPWLDLKGVSTGDFQEALQALVGDGAEGLSPATISLARNISRLKRQWEAAFACEEPHTAWQERDLSDRRYVYWWADGIYFNIRAEAARQCLLVIIGVTEAGTKEFVAIDDGIRESEQSWTELLIRVRDRQNLAEAPRLAIGDGALGFWKALTKVFGTTRHQRCWVHKTANILNKLPKSLQKKAKGDLHAIWMAPTKAAAERAFDAFLAAYGAKYPKVAECLAKDRQQLLAFYDFPAVHWTAIRTINPIESTFATVRLRTDKTRGCVSRTTILALVWFLASEIKLGQSAQKRWKRLRGFRLLPKVYQGTPFQDGEEITNTEENNSRDAA